ncbi:uncharacterized protein (DUF2267 family) [Phyllobacterium ifriqiyense]|uniref:Uncharacterized protein (DUF2267 family) n=1 Tax=Phyllobacterium ifriqiyense TaxID=314238 RepID=A0ABU0SDZ9_9HYPH|nr:DUF2267 domain-containing protein [Phyllobacterium ifriqiyense]MDQ0999001.1 uncharacterized protein (DUF2267 family) [Phyllobacterium ifriqiyense]
MTQPQEIVQASKQFQDWLAALKAKSMFSTHNQSFASMRGVMHGLRRHMDTDQILTFADALPPLPRGLFLEGWRPALALPLQSEAQLAKEVYDNLTAHHSPPETIVSDVLATIAQHLDPHNAKMAGEQLPTALKPIWSKHRQDL